MKYVVRAVSYVIAGIAGIATIIVALALLNVIASASLRTFLSPPTCCIDESITNKLATWAYGDPLMRPTGKTGVEMAAANMDSEAITRWVNRCTSIALTNPEVFARVKAAFGENGDHYATDPSNALTQENVIPLAGDLNFLSDSITRTRIENARNAANAYIILEISTWGAILLGLSTTVLVSLSSTEFGKGDGRISRSIRVLAIVFPALGTAVAAITAFYAPREDLARSSQALVSARQIHDQIASDIGQIPCPSELESLHEGGVISLKLLEWKKSVTDSRALADAASLAAVDPTRNIGQAPSTQQEENK